MTHPSCISLICAKLWCDDTDRGKGRHKAASHECVRGGMEELCWILQSKTAVPHLLCKLASPLPTLTTDVLDGLDSIVLADFVFIWLQQVRNSSDGFLCDAPRFTCASNRGCTTVLLLRGNVE